MPARDGPQRTPATSQPGQAMEAPPSWSGEPCAAPASPSPSPRPAGPPGAVLAVPGGPRLGLPCSQPGTVQSPRVPRRWRHRPAGIRSLAFPEWTLRGSVPYKRGFGALAAGRRPSATPWPSPGAVGFPLGDICLSPVVAPPLPRHPPHYFIKQRQTLLWILPVQTRMGTDPCLLAALQATPPQFGDFEIS